MYICENSIYAEFYGLDTQLLLLGYSDYKFSKLFDPQKITIRTIYDVTSYTFRVKVWVRVIFKK